MWGLDRDHTRYVVCESIDEDVLYRKEISGGLYVKPTSATQHTKMNVHHFRRVPDIKTPMKANSDSRPPSAGPTM